MNKKDTKIAHSGAGYFIKGFSLINTKGIRPFVLIPLTVNILLFATAFTYAFTLIDEYMVMLTNWLPEMFHWLTYLLWPMSVIVVLVFSSFLFSSVANWIAAPFNGLLAEKVEAKLTGAPEVPGGVVDIIKDVPRTFSREWCKFRYYLPRALGFFILSFIPIIGQIMWFLFLSWMMAVQYKDYGFDNHKIPFSEMRSRLKTKQGLSYSFGMTTAIFSMIPFVNLVVMPVAICGATAIWVDHYRALYKNQ